METKSYKVHFVGPNGQCRLVGRDGQLVKSIKQQARFESFLKADAVARGVKSRLGVTWETTITAVNQWPNS